MKTSFCGSSLSILLLFVSFLSRAQSVYGPSAMDYQMWISKAYSNGAYNSLILPLSVANVVGRQGPDLRFRAFYQWNIDDNTIPDGSIISQIQFELVAQPQGPSGQINFRITNVPYDLSGSTPIGTIFDSADDPVNLIASGQGPNVYSQTFDGQSTFASKLSNALLQNHFALAIVYSTEDDPVLRWWYVHSVKLTVWFTPPNQNVVLDQRLESNQPYGSVELWTVDHYEPHTVPTPPIPFPVTSTQTVRADTLFAQGTYEKHHDWDDPSNVINYGEHFIHLGQTGIMSRFKQSVNSTIQAQLIDGGNPQGEIKFSDPWLIDQQTSKGPSSSGTAAILYPKGSPFVVSTGNTHYKGVFPNENPQFDPLLPNYSVDVTTAQTFTVGGTNYTGTFLQWSGASAVFQDSLATQTPVVFQNSGAVATARFKSALRTSVSTASGPNGQRKLATYGTTTHIVYPSGGSIFYSRNTSGSWSNEVALALSSTASNPSIATSTYCGCTNYGLHVVWEEVDPANPGQSVVRYRRSTDGGITWLPRVDIGVGSLPSTPVIGGFDHPAIVWKNPAGLRLRTDPQWNPSYSFSIPETDGTAREFSFAKNYDGYYLSYIQGASGSGKPWVKRFWVQLNPFSITFHPAQDLTAGYTQLTNCANTSVTTDNLARVWVAWDGYGFYDEEGAGPTVIPSARRIFLRDRVSLNAWGPPTGIQYSNTNTEPVLGVLQGSSKISLLWQSSGVDVLRYTRPISGGTVSISLLGQGRLPTEPAYTPGSTEYRMWAGLAGPPHSIVIGNGKVTRMNEGNELAFSTTRLAFLTIDSLQFGSLPPSAVSGKLWIDASEFTSVSGTLRERLSFMDDPTRYDEWLSTSAFQLGANADSLSSHFTVGMSGFRVNDERVDMNTSIADVKVEVGKSQHLVRLLKLSDLVRFSAQDTSAVFDGSLSTSNLRGRTVKVRQRTVGQDQNRQPLWAQLLKAQPPENGITGAQTSIASLTTTGKDIPINYAVHPNHPNPFNPTTQIRFDLPEASNVTLVIYDILGRQVTELVKGEYEAGYHSATWNASSFASGIYLARFTVTDVNGAMKLSTTQKLVLAK